MKKIGLIALVVVLALGVIGVGYAAWAQSLTVNATVNTGYISASFDSNVSGVTTDANPLTTVSMSRSYSGAQDAAGHGLWDELNITVSNAYPGYTGTVTFYVDNNGTVSFAPSAGTITVWDPSAGYTSNVIDVTPNISGSVAPGSYGTYTLNINIPGAAVGGWADPGQNRAYTVTVPLTATQD